LVQQVLELKPHDLEQAMAPWQPAN